MEEASCPPRTSRSPSLSHHLPPSPPPNQRADQFAPQSLSLDRELGRAAGRPRAWGSTSAVAIDPGRHQRLGRRALRRIAAAVAESIRRRRSPATARSSTRSSSSMPSGKLVKSFGAGMMLFPHGIHVDRDGNVWVTDGLGPRTARAIRCSSSARRQGADDARQGRRRRAADRTSSTSRPTSSSRRTATSSSPTDTAATPTRAS